RPSLSGRRFLELEAGFAPMFTKREPTIVARVGWASRALRRMAAICAGRDARLVVVLVPDEIQVSSDLQARVLERLAPLSREDFDFSRPNRLLRAELARYGIATIDLLDPFLEGASRKTLYKPNDGHWNIGGNRLAAKRLAGALRASGALAN
ncbi:MAG: alginate O-acetyltransferase AlgX-related protein, partial [Candidatus Binatia bacterium]